MPNEATSSLESFENEFSCVLGLVSSLIPLSALSPASLSSPGLRPADS